MRHARWHHSQRTWRNLERGPVLELNRAGDEKCQTVLGVRAVLAMMQFIAAIVQYEYRP